MENKILDDIAKCLNEVVPKSVQTLADDLETQFKAVLQDSFKKMDLVTREEFDAQAKVLARLRKKLSSLEKQIKILSE